MAAPPRLELGRTESKSVMLPLHHGAISMDFLIDGQLQREVFYLFGIHYEGLSQPTYHVNRKLATQVRFELTHRY